MQANKWNIFKDDNSENLRLTFTVRILDPLDNQAHQFNSTVIGGYVFVGVKSAVEFINGSYLTAVRLINSANPVISYTLNLWDSVTESFQFLTGPGGTVNTSFLLFNTSNSNNWKEHVSRQIRNAVYHTEELTGLPFDVYVDVVDNKPEVYYQCWNNPSGHVVGLHATAPSTFYRVSYKLTEESTVSHFSTLTRKITFKPSAFTTYNTPCHNPPFCIGTLGGFLGITTSDEDILGSGTTYNNFDLLVTHVDVAWSSGTDEKDDCKEYTLTANVADVPGGSLVKYWWSTDATTQSITTRKGGTYWVNMKVYNPAIEDVGNLLANVTEFYYINPNC